MPNLWIDPSVDLSAWVVEVIDRSADRFLYIIAADVSVDELQKL